MSRRPRVRTAHAVTFLLLVASCGGRASGTVPPPPRLGSTHITDDTIPPPRDPPPAVREVATAVRALVDHEGTREHVNVVRALRALANATRWIAPDREVETAQIARAADALKSSHERSSQHADHVRYGLEAVVRVFAAAAASDPSTAEYGGLVDQLARAVEAIDPDLPLLDQEAVVDRAFSIAARTSFRIYDADLVFATIEE